MEEAREIFSELILALPSLSVTMPPPSSAPYASKFGSLWVRLKYIGEGEAPSREYVAEELLFQSSWVTPQDIYSFIMLPNKRDYELCFVQEPSLRRFLEMVSSQNNNPKWKVWMTESQLQIDTTTLIVKFWTGRIPDQDIELYLKRFCDILQPPVKPLDKFGIWYGIRKYKIRLKKDSSGHYVQIPNSISLGPYNGRIIYPGQIPRCFICQEIDHQVRECPTIKCWKCGDLGHRAKNCQNQSECSLCGVKGHSFFGCPKSYSNMAKRPRQPITDSSVMVGQSLDVAGSNRSGEVTNQMLPPFDAQQATKPSHLSSLREVEAVNEPEQNADGEHQVPETQHNVDQREGSQKEQGDTDGGQGTAPLFLESSDEDDDERNNASSSENYESASDSEDFGSTPTSSPEVHNALHKDPESELRKIFLNKSHPSMKEPVNETSNENRKRSVSTSSPRKGKRKDSRPSPT